MKYMLAACLLCLSLATEAQAQSILGVLQNEAAFRATTLTLSASGDIVAAPDVAVLRLGVKTEASTASEAIGANARLMKEVISGLRKEGVPAKDIQTSSLQLFQQQDRDHRASYEATNGIAVTLHDTTRVGGILDAAVSRGVNQVQGVNFSASHANAALDAARQEAVQKLQAQAGLYARATGYKIVRLVTLTEFVIPPSSADEIIVTARRIDADDTPVEGGQLHGAVRVTGVYELGR